MQTESYRIPEMVRQKLNPLINYVSRAQGENETVFGETLEFSLNGAKLSLNSVNSGNLENLRNH